MPEYGGRPRKVLPGLFQYLRPMPISMLTGTLQWTHSVSRVLSAIVPERESPIYHDGMKKRVSVDPCGLV